MEDVLEPADDLFEAGDLAAVGVLDLKDRGHGRVSGHNGGFVFPQHEAAVEVRLYARTPGVVVGRPLQDGDLGVAVQLAVFVGFVGDRRPLVGVVAEADGDDGGTCDHVGLVDPFKLVTGFGRGVGTPLCLVGAVLGHLNDHLAGDRAVFAALDHVGDGRPLFGILFLPVGRRVVFCAGHGGDVRRKAFEGIGVKRVGAGLGGRRTRKGRRVAVRHVAFLQHRAVFIQEPDQVRAAVRVISRVVIDVGGHRGDHGVPAGPFVVKFVGGAERRGLAVIFGRGAVRDVFIRFKQRIRRVGVVPFDRIGVNRLSELGGVGRFAGHGHDLLVPADKGIIGRSGGVIRNRGRHGDRLIFHLGVIPDQRAVL